MPREVSIVSGAGFYIFEFTTNTPNGWIGDFAGDNEEDELFSDVSLRAIAIDPASTVHELVVRFRNPSQASTGDTITKTVGVAVGSPFLGLLSSFTVSVAGEDRRDYNVVLTPGPAFLNSAILIDWFQNTAALPTVSPSVTTLPRLLAQVWFKDPPEGALPTQRAPLETGVPFTIINGARSLVSRLPFFGRKKLYVAFDKGATVGAMTFELVGHKFVGPTTEYDTLLASGSIPIAGGDLEFAFEGKAFDAIELAVTGTVSDAARWHVELND